jgi:hypothetical protein
MPSSRDITINDGDPIPAWLLNKLQDMVDAAKHPEIPRGIAANKFSFASGWLNNGGNLAATAPTVTAYAALELPVGDRITTVKWGYGLTGAGTIQMRLYRQRLDGSAVAELITPVSGTTSDSAVGANKTSIVTYNHQIVDDYTYFLQVDASASTIRLYGAIVRHDNL